MDASHSNCKRKRQKGNALIMNVPFFMHDLGAEELSSVGEVLKGPILTTGETVFEFERRFAQYLGKKHALALNSCTGAMHLSLLALDIGPGDEVITTPMTFVATTLAILEAGAKPIFVDVEPETGNIDVSQIQKSITKKTKAILPVHLYGLLCDMKPLNNICQKNNLRLIEDAAHCVEGKRDGIRPGDLSDTACFSFYATKNLSCGEGGALVTNDSELYKKLKLLRLHGMTKTAADRHKEGYKPWDVEVFGWKYNMDNIHAALLLPQLSKIERNLSKRRELYQLYRQALQDVPNLRWPVEPQGAEHARHLLAVWLENDLREAVLQDFIKAGIGAMVNYTPVHLLTYFKNTFGFKKGDFPVAEKLGSEVLSLPFYPTMPEAHIYTVAQVLKKRLGK